MVKPKKKISLVLLAVALILVAISGFVLNKRLNQPIDDEEAIRQEFARTATTDTGVVSIDIKDEWAVVETQPIDPKTGEFLDAGPGLHIFRKINGRWQRAMNQSTVNAWLEEIPESLLSPEVKERLR